MTFNVINKLLLTILTQEVIPEAMWCWLPLEVEQTVIRSCLFPSLERSLLRLSQISWRGMLDWRELAWFIWCFLLYSSFHNPLNDPMVVAFLDDELQWLWLLKVVLVWRDLSILLNCIFSLLKNFFLCLLLLIVWVLDDSARPDNCITLSYGGFYNLFQLCFSFINRVL